MQVSGHIRRRTNINKETCYQVIIELPKDVNTGKRQRIYETVKCSKKAAEQYLRKRIDEIEGYGYVKSNPVTVSEWVNQWYELYQKNILSPTTQRGYKYNIDNYIVDSSVGNISVQELTAADVQKWINNLQEHSPVSGKKMSSKTVKNIYHNLSAAMDKAVANDIVKKNVCKLVVLPKLEKYRAEVYDEDEILQLIEKSKNTDMYLPIMIELTLGLRRGELLGLKWSHVDLDKKQVMILDNLVEVEKSYDKNRYVTKKPKSVSGERIIPIADELVEILKQYRVEYMKEKLRLGREFHDGDYVVCQADGTPYKPASFTKKFRKFLENNGMKHIRLHDLRHTNATLMLTRGISPKVAQMRLGHSDFSTTMNIYSHVLESVECSAAQEIENALFRERSF